MLTLCALYYIKPSTQGVNVNPVPKGLMLTQFALGTHSAAGTHSAVGTHSTQVVNVNPLRTGLN